MLGQVYKLVASLGSKQDGLSENQKGLRARQDQMDRTLQRVRGRDRLAGAALVLGQASRAVGQLQRA